MMYANPDIMRGLRALGIPEAARTHRLGGNLNQVLRASSGDLFNTWTSPMAGPFTRGIFAGLSGQELGVRSTTDYRARVRTELWPALPDNPYRFNAPGMKLKGVPAEAAWRAKAAGREINRTFFDALPTMVGLLPKNPQRPEEESGYRQAIDSVFSGLIKNEPKTAATENQILRQRLLMER
jgi:hypothetical protein